MCVGVCELLFLGDCSWVYGFMGVLVGVGRLPWGRALSLGLLHLSRLQTIRQTVCQSIRSVFPFSPYRLYSNYST